MGELYVAALGPLRVQRDGVPVQLGPRLVGLLSVLVMEVGRPIPAGRLVDLLWGYSAPTGAFATLRSHVSHLRRALEPEHRANSGRGRDGVVVTASAGAGIGYWLNLAPERVDVRHFENLCTEGRQLLLAGRADETERAASVVGEALAMWRGPAFADMADRPFAVPEIARLNELRHSARRSHAEALQALGRYAEVIEDLSGVVAAEPHDEGLRRLLALALYAEHRVDEAAQVCREGLTLLNQRGLDAPGLEELQRTILRREVQTALTFGAAASSPLPRLLPTDPPRFVGRDEELEEARRLLGGRRNRSEMLMIVGPAGVGKTSLAVRLGHAVAEQFPDGQLFAKLQGFHPEGSTMTVGEALRAFLDALRVPPQRVPAGLGAQVGLYRSLLAERRMLIVLDNACDAEQVRPLLPGSAACAVIVTSRNHLTSLVTVEGAHPLTLDLLPTADARSMLAQRVGAARVAAEPGTVDDIITGCARLPLALAVVAARAATYPSFPLAVLADELRDHQRRLDALSGGDAATDVRTAFSWSYKALSKDAARLFRLFGLHPGPDISTPPVASLAGAPVARVRPLLAELARTQLVTEHCPGRYAFHDLLRAYARELAYTHDTDAERRAALRRVLDHYLHTAHAGDLLLNPHPWDPIVLAPARPGVIIEELADHGQAMAWFKAEYPVLIAAVSLAAGTELHTHHAWQLAKTLVEFFDRQGHWHDWAETQRIALDSARRLADQTGQACAQRQLALACARLGRYDEAGIHLHHALDLSGTSDDQTGHVHHTLAWLLTRQGRHQEALTHARRALARFRATGHQVGQARALNAVGWSHAHLGDHRQAIADCKEALSLLREINDRVGEAGTWDTLGCAHHHLRDHRQALTCYHRALDLFRDLDNRRGEAATLTRLGETHHRMGNHDLVREMWARALDIFDELGDPVAEQVRAKLHSLDGRAKPAKPSSTNPPPVPRSPKSRQNEH